MPITKERITIMGLILFNKLNDFFLKFENNIRKKFLMFDLLKRVMAIENNINNGLNKNVIPIEWRAIFIAERLIKLNKNPKDKEK